MKLAFVEVEGFRGFRGRTFFKIPTGFAVLTGRNGTGKSTVFDAIDFALTGTINKFDVKEAKGGGLDSHIWWIGDQPAEDHRVTIGFRAEDGDIVTITRSRDRGLSPAEDELAGYFCVSDAADESWSETLMRTTLIRDETLSSLSLDLPQQARFEAVRAAIGPLTGPDHSGRTDALFRAGGNAKVEQEAKVKAAQAELGRALTALTEARSVADRQTDVAQAEAIIRRLAPAPGETSSEPERLRRIVAERKQAVADLTQVLGRANNLSLSLIDFDARKAEQDRSTFQSEIDVAARQVTQAQDDLATAEQLNKAETELDQFTSQFAALLAHGEAIGLQEHHCPLCDAERSDQEFASAIASARARLSERGEQLKAASDRLSSAQLRVSTAGIQLTQLQGRLAALETRLSGIASETAAIQAAYDRYSIAASPTAPAEAQRQTLRLQDETNELEQALYILEASGAHDRVASLEGRVEQLRQLVEEETARLATAERVLEVTRQIKNAATTVSNQVLTEQFDTVMPLLKELYRRLRPHTDWREIETDFGGKVRASLNFTVGDGRNPQFLFSSGQRRAAGLAFLLAIHLSRPWCRLQTLWLDDPVQHVDDYRALNLVEVLSAIRRGGRQVIVAVEDPALADLLCRRLRSSDDEPGRRFELGTAKSGSATIEQEFDIDPMPKAVLPYAEAS